MIDSPRVLMFERHAQTVLTLLVCALLTWVGYSTHQNQIQLAQLTIRIEFLQQQVIELKYEQSQE